MAAGKARAVMEQLFWIIGIACMLYYVIITAYAGFGVSFGWFWPALGILCFGMALLIRSGKWQALPAWLRYGLTGCAAAGGCLFLVLLVFVIRGMFARTERQPEYLIVLGSQVRGDVPSRSLKFRLDEAASQAEKYPQAKLILSGGKGDGENISEAECMFHYLKEQGIPESRLLLEDQSTSTLENLLFSDRLYACAQKPCGIISNAFHISRAAAIAKKSGYADAWGIPARCGAVLLLHDTVREVFAFVNEWRKGTI